MGGIESVDLELIDIVQLPLSLHDQRMLENGTVARLRSSGVAIHARSIYMQGLLLTADRNGRLVSADIRTHHRNPEKLARPACRLIDLTIGFARAQKDIECALFGVCSSESWRNYKIWFSTTPGERVNGATGPFGIRIFLTHVLGHVDYGGPSPRP